MLGVSSALKRLKRLKRFKRLERGGRRLLVWLLGTAVAALRLCSRRWASSTPIKAPATQSPSIIGLPPAARIQVIRLDQRLGNAVMMTTMLQRLGENAKTAQIDVLANWRFCALLGRHPVVAKTIPFDKRRLIGEGGVLRAMMWLRRQQYDLIIDAANPTDPSSTQALLTALAGGRFTIGPGHGPFAPVYSHSVEIMQHEPSSDELGNSRSRHEIAMRCDLLTPLAVERLPGMELQFLPRLPKVATLADTPALALLHSKLDEHPFAALVVASRRAEKDISVVTLAALVDLCVDNHLRPMLVYGPAEGRRAQQVIELAGERAVLAPPTDIATLGVLLQSATVVVTADSGPMHYSVALGTPTCGIFVATCPGRYGYDLAPHLALDARDRPGDAAGISAAVSDWLVQARGPVKATRGPTN